MLEHSSSFANAPSITEVSKNLREIAAQFEAVSGANREAALSAIKDVLRQIAEQAGEIRKIGGNQFVRPQFRRVSTPSQEIFEDCARLYNDNQHVGPDGLVDPFNPAYRYGGGHFQRTAEWYEKQLETQGAQLVVVESDGKMIGNSLFFTEAETFPPLASDVLPLRDIPGIQKLAYTYLFVIDKEFRGLGIAEEILRQTISVCRQEGCDALAHEFFVRPHLNLHSANLHYNFLARQFGAIDSGRTACHTIEKASGGEPAQVFYAQFLIPTEYPQKQFIRENGTLSLKGSLSETQ